nr:MAG TPA: hypothetical protein [Bacteriophage sp.]
MLIQYRHYLHQIVLLLILLMVMVFLLLGIKKIKIY